MKKIKFNVPIYDMEITCLILDKNDDFMETIYPQIKNFPLPNEEFATINNNVQEHLHSGGTTYRFMTSRKILVLIYPCKSEKERRNVLNHEKRHVEDRILEHFGVKDIESSALLAGFLSEKIY